jgi:predicted CoA-binding protein
MKKTLVIGASTNPDRYSFLAINRLLHFNHEVCAIGIKPGQVGSVTIETGQPAFSGIDTITLYLNPERQKAYYQYILSLHPQRIIFNPGTENDELIALAEKAQIQCMEACTLVMLSTGQY